MNKKTTTALGLVLVLAALAVYLVVPSEHPEWLKRLLVWQPESARSLDFRLGLDLQGGLQVLMVADVADQQALTAETMRAAAQIVEGRVNGLGLSEPVVQVQGTRRIIVELPGIANPEQAIDTIRDTALLEFAEPPAGAGDAALEPGRVVSTTYGLAEGGVMPPDTYTTVLIGDALDSAFSTIDDTSGRPMVIVRFKAADTQRFYEYTRNNIGRPLCMVLDKAILSCPTIRDAIPSGEAQISGGFTSESAQQLAIQLRYGALPVPLKIESYRAIGPSLGALSVEKSIRAGVVGLVVVFLFMLIYYRLNGLAADLALALYVLLNLLLYKLLPVTMTLPGIAGFLLSAGMAVDANILVFERMKEELRHGRSLQRGTEAGFSRAWTSVRDSNLATLLTCAILWFFGNAFAASLVKGFALTLALGTLINMFTALVVTRTFVRLALGLLGEERLRRYPWLLGI